MNLKTASHPGHASLTAGVKKTSLANGLTVLTKEIRTAPVVSVQVWYRVGSRNESAGLNGISHQLEHLMFKGTQERPLQFGRLFSALGSAFNAFTSYDMTAYFGTVSQNKLEALLTLEADRMVNTLITEEHLTSEKRVVISELQGYENSPEYRLSRAVMQAAFPASPYGLPVGGSRADVAAFRLDNLQTYYRQYYAPNNAVLVITGDFDTELALAQVQQTFGQIPPISLSLTTATQPPVFAAAAPIVLREPGSAFLLEIVYPLPDALHPDNAAIEVMDTILSGGRSSRLYQAVVESGLASGMTAYAATLLEHGWYDIAAIAAPEQSLAEIEQAILAAITDLQQQPVSLAELERAKTQLQAHFILRNRDLDNQASQLAYDQLITGDYQHSDRHLAAIQPVSAADVQRVAQVYLDAAKRTVGWFEPTELADQPALPGGGLQTSEDFSPGEPVDPAEVGRYLPAFPAQVSSASQTLPDLFVLENGLRVLLLPDTSTATITLAGHIQAGNCFDALTRPGEASLTAENLLNGTRQSDALALAERLENCGAGLDFNAYREGVDIDGYALAADLPILLTTLAEVLQASVFPADQLELTRQQALSDLQIELDDPQRLGRRVFQQAIYLPDHPFASFPTLESLQAISRAEVLNFYQQFYRPPAVLLALVGNFDPAAARSLLKDQFGQWQSPRQIPALTFPAVALPAATTYLHSPLPGKSQDVAYLGYPGITRHDPRFYAALLLNQVLGGDTLSSRLGAEIRDRQGLTYGIYSYFAAGQQPGPFLVQIQTDPADTEAAIASTLKLLEQLRQDGISAAELATAQRTLIDSYPVELANLDNLARMILSNAVYGLPLAEIRQFPDRLAAVTLAQVNQAIADLIHPDQMMVVTAGSPR
ncbi:MAG: insulinase family protein [Aphanocapsa sp. GSE-SYN-MK-11-07L]|jgi:zinc protease|nr:insulinase family protein [Aphanocapsa sp. GSE-SYN-MK-11-07L]